MLLASAAVLVGALLTIWVMNLLWKAVESSARRNLDCLSCEDSGFPCEDCGPIREDDHDFTKSLARIGARKRTISDSRRAGRDDY